MAYIYKNPNPIKNLVGDCVIRGISILTDTSWEYTYDQITKLGRQMYDMPSSNEVWMTYLKMIGYKKRVIPNSCPDCYTIRDFCYDNPYGKFLLATGSHVIAVIDGDGDGRYSEEGSYRRGRDRMGRYTSRDGYSGEEKEQMMRQIEEMKRKVEQM